VAIKLGDIFMSFDYYYDDSTFIFIKPYDPYMVNVSNEATQCLCQQFNTCNNDKMCQKLTSCL